MRALFYAFYVSAYTCVAGAVDDSLNEVNAESGKALIAGVISRVLMTVSAGVANPLSTAALSTSSGITLGIFVSF